MKEAIFFNHAVTDLPYADSHRGECRIRQEFCDYYVADCPFPDCRHICEEAGNRSAELNAMVHKSKGNYVDS